MEYFRTERPTYVYNSLYMSDKHHLMVNFTHTLCGNTRDMQFNYVMRGEGCMFCHISGGEESIKYALDELGVVYEQEKSYDDLLSVTNKRTLRYDFYLPGYNMLIEYDGRQHTKHISTWIKEETYLRYMENDDTKNKYAISKGITLLRIPYTYKGSELMELVKKFIDGNIEVISKYSVNEK